MNEQVGSVSAVFGSFTLTVLRNKAFDVLGPCSAASTPGLLFNSFLVSRLVFFGGHPNPAGVRSRSLTFAEEERILVWTKPFFKKGQRLLLK